MEFNVDLLEEIREEANLVQKAHNAFKHAQDMGSEDYRQAKTRLMDDLGNLNDRMNRYLARQYGKDEADYDQWLKSHQPFHWMAEFYGIIEEDGGFDVVIGNPPYVEYSTVRKKKYTVRNYKTETCGNLYAFFMERAIAISGQYSKVAYIVPVSIISTPGYSTLRHLYLFKGMLHVSSYNIHPSRLFQGAYPRLSIVLLNRASNNTLFSSRYQKWYARERTNLLNLLYYHEVPDTHYVYRPWPKINSLTSFGILKKIGAIQAQVKNFTVTGPQNKTKPIFYRRAFGAFVLFYDEVPEMYDESNNIVTPTELKSLMFSPRHHALMLGIYHSSTFYLFTHFLSDCRNMNKEEVKNFNIDLNGLGGLEKELSDLAHDLGIELKKNSRVMEYKYSTGRRKFRAFFPRDSKETIDKVDRILSQYYGFTEEELDYIINYDIKYRMGIN